jgi:hypothetical protein
MFGSGIEARKFYHAPPSGAFILLAVRLEFDFLRIKKTMTPKPFHPENKLL